MGAELLGLTTIKACVGSVDELGVMPQSLVVGAGAPRGLRLTGHHPPPPTPLPRHKQPRVARCEPDPGPDSSAATGNSRRCSDNPLSPLTSRPFIKMRERVHLTRGWEYKEEGRGTWQPASQVPGSIHTDLLHNGQIPDPFVDLNELAVRWVAERDWWYRRAFSPDELRQRDGPSAAPRRVELVFEGLDTFATVYLNDDKVLVTDNMFTSHRVDVTSLLSTRAGNIELKILFQSASVRGRQLVKDHPEHNFLVRQTEAARLPVRKAQFPKVWKPREAANA